MGTFWSILKLIKTSGPKAQLKFFVLPSLQPPHYMSSFKRIDVQILKSNMGYAHF
jgi:hypothetical protein